MNKVKLINGVFIGVTVGYTTFMLLNDKSDELVHEGGMLQAFTVGAGQMGLAIAAGVMAAKTVVK